MSDANNDYPSWYNQLRNKHKKEAIKHGIDCLAFDPEFFKHFIQQISTRVKHDKPTKTLVFLTGLSAFGGNPLNLFLRGKSSIGKTYNVTNTLKYFPDANVWMLGGLSPTALVHDYGDLIDENGNKVDFMDKPQKRAPRKRKSESEDDYKQRLQQWKTEKESWRERIRKSRYIVDLHKKVIVFLEAPHRETYNKLRPVLSHDKPEISYKFTDKTPFIVLKE